MKHLALKDIFTPPIRMTEHCGHNFCHTCISNFIASQETSNQASAERPQRPRSRNDLILVRGRPVLWGPAVWNCPECRSEQTTQPNHLVRNRLVEKAVKQFHASRGSSQSKALCPHHELELSICMSSLLS